MLKLFIIVGGLAATVAVLSNTSWGQATAAPAKAIDPYNLKVPDSTRTHPAAIYTLANAPSTPKLESLPLQASITQYGITWGFHKPVRVGQFINGD